MNIDIGLNFYVNDDYTWYDVIWGKGIAYGIFTSLLALCGVIGLHMGIALVGLHMNMNMP